MEYLTKLEAAARLNCCDCVWYNDSQEPCFFRISDLQYCLEQENIKAEVVE
jgi:hypothetical protein